MPTRLLPAVRALFAAFLVLAAPLAAAAGQTGGAAALGARLAGLGVSARVLVIGAHPDDEDTRLITFLARGRHVRTAYLSLTRGDGGQNLIGNELGEALGVIRAEELLAARRLDRGIQYFTRAYDFGFSKSAEETFEHWPHDSLLGDVVRVVRAFQPHVIVGLFSGTPRDGHGQHQVSGILAREAYDVSGDTVRFPRAAFGPPWTVGKFYRSTRARVEDATHAFNAGEYDPLIGRSYAEIAAESRSQHKSQAFGQIAPLGAAYAGIRREAARIGPSDAAAEQDLFAGMDTSLARLRDSLPCAAARGAVDSVRAAAAEARRRFDAFDPSAVRAPLGRALAALRRIDCLPASSDAAASMSALHEDLLDAWALASGLAFDALVPREIVAIGNSIPIVRSVHNRGTAAVRLRAGEREIELLPDSAWRDTVPRGFSPATRDEWIALMQPAWLAAPRAGDMFAVPLGPRPSSAPPDAAVARVGVVVEGGVESLAAPIVHRYADPIRGEVRRPLAVAPAVAVTLDRSLQLAPARTALDRVVRVQLRSADTAPREVRVSLALPAGLRADSAARTVTLQGPGATATMEFRLTGMLAPGRHEVAAVAESGGERFTAGYALIDYEHIRPRRLYRDAVLAIEAVDVRIPAGLRVAYIPGVSDNVAPALVDLGVPVTVVPPDEVAGADLSRFTTIVVGPRAYEASDGLVAANDRLLAFARRGGTLVVQYGQYEMTRPGIMPHPITIARPHDRVTVEESPVRLLRPDHPQLRAPNRITLADFEGWVQERSLYMPRTFGEAYVPLVAVREPGDEERTGALLIAPFGEGVYVYTTLAFFRQLPAGVPGAARLFVNLLGASAGANGGSR
ncbi:MAG TPA: PIG-L family deacetylase [Gemmatimonadaceae bacterium]|nr:PIG-L family deacetylase [Gemmatimonadaceae bacterium]